MARLSEFGEKRLIEELISPLFNPGKDPRGVGDDCAAIEASSMHELLASTDRVPADLIAFGLGILDHHGLGSYLARLNLSDIAAAGGAPRALLLNAGVPAAMDVEELRAICVGFAESAARWGCEVLGGDLSLSTELSLSATALGVVPRGKMLSRRGAKAGDGVFISRPAGLTPAAFAALCGKPVGLELGNDERRLLEAQFLLEPMFDLIKSLGAARPGACMDNTDGLGQSLAELSAASEVAFVISDQIEVPEFVTRVADAIGADPLQLALSPGADFGLVMSFAESVESRLPASLMRIGTVELGTGVWLESNGERMPLAAAGWDHFQSSAPFN